jgi:hypothetical protein
MIVAFNCSLADTGLDVSYDTSSTDLQEARNAIQRGLMLLFTRTHRIGASARAEESTGLQTGCTSCTQTRAWNVYFPKRARAAREVKGANPASVSRRIPGCLPRF